MTAYNHCLSLVTPSDLHENDLESRSSPNSELNIAAPKDRLIPRSTEYGNVPFNTLCYNILSAFQYLVDLLIINGLVDFRNTC